MTVFLVIGALLITGAVCVNRSTVRLHKMPHNREPQT